MEHSTSSDNNIPKTLFLEVAHRFGGSGTRLINLLKNLPKNRIALACLSSSETAKALKPFGVEIHVIGTNKFDPRILPRVGKIIREGGFEVLDTQNIQSKFWGSLVVLFNKVAFVSTVNSAYMKEYGANLKGRIYHFLDLVTNTKLDMLIAVSAEVEQMLLKAGVAGEKIAMIRNSVDLDDTAISADPVRLREQFKLPADAKVGVAIGRLEWAKGFDVLIPAVGKVLGEDKDFCCILVGDGPLRDQLQASVAQAGLRDRIIFAGFQPLEQVFQIVKSSDMFIMPSRTEGTPMALLEAASLGRPIIASNVGGIPDVVTDGEQALLVPAEDAAALANKIVLLCKDQDFATRLGQAAKARVKAGFAPDVQVAAVKRTYQQAVRNFRKES